MAAMVVGPNGRRSEEHMSELQSPCNLVFRLLLVKTNLGFSQVVPFNSKKYLTGDPSTLSLEIESINLSNGDVSINGGDSILTIPFTWICGHLNINDGLFP